VLGVHGAAAHIDGRAVDLVDAEQIEGEARADDVADGIDRADFVEVHLFYGDAVDGGFRLAEDAEDALGVGLDRVGQIGGVNHFQDAAQVPVLLRLSDRYAKFSGAHAPALDAFPLDGRHRWQGRSAREMASRSAPASANAPTSMSPARPEKASR
jgi:hypothetical protein